MTRFAQWAFLAAMLPVAACSSNPPPAPVPVAPPAPPPLAQADQTFVNAAAANDAFVVQAGQLAQTKARSSRVKTEASNMVTAHTQSTQQLMQIAQTKGVTPDATLTSDDQNMLTALQNASPRTFDSLYLRDSATARREAGQIYQDEVNNGQDADLKQYATTTMQSMQPAPQAPARRMSHATHHATH